MMINFRTLIHPNEYTCFYQQFPTSLTIHLDVVVYSPFQPELTLNVFVHTKQVAKRELVRTARVEFDTSREGAGQYSFCFDNNFSMHPKLVSFYLTSNDEYEDPTFQSKRMELVKDELGEFTSKYAVLKQQLYKMTQTFEEIQRLQVVYSEYERIDRFTAEQNFSMVNSLSSFSLALMLIASYLQVFLIKSLFDDNSRVGRALRGKITSRKSY
ncbi:unnamed protein product [Sphagnum balticum]